MNSNNRSLFTTKLAKIVKVSAIGILSFNAITSFAAVSEDLQKLNARWQQVFSAKDLTASKSYYNENSLVAGFPYDATKGLKGATAIGNMFQNGPFKLQDFKVKVTPIGFDENGQSALLLKKWQVSHSGPAFSGLAVEVLAKKPAGWKRIIDMSAGGFASATDFAKAPTIQQKLFKTITTQATQVSQLAVTEQDSTLNAKISSAVQAGNYENLSNISNAENGLLIARVTIDSKTYMTFNALVKSATGWDLQVQFFSAS